MSNMNDSVQRFLESPEFAVVGASVHREKYGNKVLRCYAQHGLAVTPVNPRTAEIEGMVCASSLTALAKAEAGVSIITPPGITLAVVEEAAAAGYSRLWMQPGAESAEAIARAAELGLELIHSGPCLLVVLGYED
ncbi:MAG: putative CoA-binding protein [Pseudohongiellaceae bacterium]|jgi:predicted CoA-binding protein